MNIPKPKEDPNKTIFTKEEQDKQNEAVETPDYSEDEKIYLDGIQKRLESARDERDKEHDEYDGLSFVDHWNSNEIGANTITKYKTNKGEGNFQSGTLRTKMLSFLSSYLGLNLSPDISAYTENDVKINSLGNAMEDVLEKVGRLDNEEEQRMLRQYEMLKQGTVFIEDLWEEKWDVKKKMNAPFLGRIKGIKIIAKLKLLFGRPRRRIVSMLSVYLGDITQYFIKNQPYIFTVEIKDYKVLEKEFESWERWKYVSRTKKSFASGTAEESSMQMNAWRLYNDTPEGKVEVVKYQDQLNNEYQIFLNGVPMLPIGFALTEITPTGEYTLEQQNLEPIRHNFAYGKSFIFRNKNIVAILDAMMRLAVLKTKKSYMPPRLNNSKKILSRKMFLPGEVTKGIKPTDIPLVDDRDAQGVTSSEFAMIQELIRFNDRNTVSQTFAGSETKGGQTTATEITETQRQARIMMGLIVLAATLLEQKITEQRLNILLQKWFDPVDKTMDEARGVLVNKYRTTSKVMSIPGEGQGFRFVVPTDGEIPASNEIRAKEDEIKKRMGSPVRIIMIKPDEIKKMKLTWIINVNAKEKRSSELSKLLFRQEVGDALALGLNLKPEWIQDRFAGTWEEDSNKMFSSVPPQAQQQEAGAESKPMTPKLPSPAKAPEVRP